MLGILRDRVLTMAELADYLGLERSTVSGLVDRAERRGLVARQASDRDGRSIQLSLSREGQTLATVAAETVAKRLSPVVDGLPDGIRRALPSALAELASRR
jgi:DNA-binding MarR family transcriptional regulator